MIEDVKDLHQVKDFSFHFSKYGVMEHLSPAPEACSKPLLLRMKKIFAYMTSCIRSVVRILSEQSLCHTGVKVPQSYKSHYSDLE